MRGEPRGFSLFKKNMETYLTTTYDETQKLGEEFAKRVGNGGIVLLYGNLGAGKTTFVQGLAKGLGVDKRIISPTFVILRTYFRKNGNFYHIDLYRLEGEHHELEEIGLFDLMKNPHTILAIEWPEKLGEYIPEKRWEIHFTTIDETKRDITIQRYE